MLQNCNKKNKFNQPEVICMKYDETAKNLDEEIRRLKTELSQLQKARKVMKKKHDGYVVVW